MPPARAQREAARAAVSATAKSVIEYDSMDDEEDGKKPRKRGRRSSTGSAAVRSASRPAPVRDNGGESAPQEEAPPAATPEQRILQAGDTHLDRACVVLDCLEELDPEQYFAQPVTDDIVPGYSEVIEEPMDYGTVRARLASEEADVDVFVEDLRLVYRNAIKCVDQAADASCLRLLTPASAC